MTEYEKQKCRERKTCDAANRFTIQNTVGLLSADRTVLATEGVILITTAGANVADVILPDPAKNLRRKITVLNYSGNSQNILSHAGSTLKVANTAAVGTHAIENASSATTGKRIFIAAKDAVGGTAYWWLAD